MFGVYQTTGCWEMYPYDFSGGSDPQDRARGILVVIDVSSGQPDDHLLTMPTREGPTVVYAGAGDNLCFTTGTEPLVPHVLLIDEKAFGTRIQAARRCPRPPRRH